MKKNNKKYFYGIYGIEFVWHGAWCDPELKWHKKSFNYYDVEMPLLETYSVECKEHNIPYNDDNFAVWVKENAYLVKEYLQNLMDCNCFYTA